MFKFFISKAKACNEPYKKLSQDTWALYSGTWMDGLPILLKIRPSIKHLIGSNAYPDRYVITWKISPTPDRIMSDEEADAIADFESFITPILEHNQNSIFVAAVTHNGERDWIFYCRNSEESHSRLNLALQNESIKPIEIMSCPDPSWNEYKGIIANIGGLTSIH